MGQLIILEGPDGAGKTHLAKELIGHNKSINYIHNGLYNNIDDMYNSYKTQIKLSTLLPGSLIVDRMHYSEFVYSTVLERETFARLQYKQLDSHVKDVNGLVIICMPSYDMCLYNWSESVKQDAEYIKRKEVFDAIYDEYAKLDFDKLRVKYIDHNYEEDDMLSLMNKVEKIL